MASQADAAANGARLQDEKMLRTLDRSMIESLQAQLKRAEAAAQQVVDQASIGPVTNMTLPLMQQVQHSLCPELSCETQK